MRGRLICGKVTRAARNEPCVCCGHPHTVFAHLPNPGDAGMGAKTDDIWGAFLCGVDGNDCHGQADQGKYRRDYEWRAIVIHKTQRRLIDLGLLRVG